MSINPFTETSSRRLGASTERFTKGFASYEAYYNGTWRDITSDFYEDITKDGNTIVRAIRWDGGFRSYRKDRGLIIRKKEDRPSPGSNIVNPFLQTFITASVATIAIKGLSLVPGPVGVIAKGVALATRSPLFRTVTLATSAAVTVGNIIGGESIEQGLGRAVGEIAGGYFGGKIGSLIRIPGFKPVSEMIPAIPSTTRKQEVQNLVNILSRLPKVQQAPYTTVGSKYEEFGPFNATQRVMDINLFGKGVQRVTATQAQIEMAKLNASASRSANKIIKLNPAGDQIIPAERKESKDMQRSLSILAQKLRKNPGIF